MGNRLFFVSEDQHVQEMNEVNIKDMLESRLQEIVEKNSDLLTREWDDQPRKLFLIAREKEVHAEEDAGNSFSLDHLLVDSEGVPILVEVKRSTDTRTRREVAAQMLDYACRASSWNIESLKNYSKAIILADLMQKSCLIIKSFGVAFLPISEQSIFGLFLLQTVFLRRFAS